MDLSFFLHQTVSCNRLQILLGIAAIVGSFSGFSQPTYVTDECFISFLFFSRYSVEKNKPWYYFYCRIESHFVVTLSEFNWCIKLEPAWNDPQFDNLKILQQAFFGHFSANSTQLELPVFEGFFGILAWVFSRFCLSFEFFGWKSLSFQGIQ